MSIERGAHKASLVSWPATVVWCDALSGGGAEGGGGGHASSKRKLASIEEPSGRRGAYFGVHVLGELEDGVHSRPGIWMLLEVCQHFLCHSLLQTGRDQRLFRTITSAGCGNQAEESAQSYEQSHFILFSTREGQNLPCTWITQLNT